MKITIAATSFVAPGNTAWSPLEAQELEFADYDEWSQKFYELASKPDNTNIFVWLIFLEDLIPLEKCYRILSSKKKFVTKVNELLHPIFVPLDHFLEHQSQINLIIGWVTPNYGSSIITARGMNLWTDISHLFEQSIRSRIQQFPNLYLLPLDLYFARDGQINCLDPRNYYFAHCHLSMQGLKITASKIAEIVDRFQNPAKKVLVLDCDNTLWGGIIGEDQLRGIALGQDGIGKAFKNFQISVKCLAQEGFLLALCSKNNEQDVWDVFENHPEMVLTKEDIVAHRINWQEKSANILELADELSLGIDSFVLWDDNPLERESAKYQLPLLEVIEMPQEVFYWPKLILDLPEFSRFQTTDEDLKRQSQYQSKVQYNKELGAANNLEAFLKTLDLKPSLLKLDQATLARAEQLCSKTNQFNVRTQRYTKIELNQMISDPDVQLFLSHLEDRFGDHGIVGFVISRRHPKESIVFLDTFLLSCRILGRHLESWMLEQCVQYWQAQGMQWLLTEYIPSKRNEIAANFFPDHGFAPLETWELEIQQLVNQTFHTLQGHSFLAHMESLQLPHLEIYDDTKA